MINPKTHKKSLTALNLDGYYITDDCQIWSDKSDKFLSLTHYGKICLYGKHHSVFALWLYSFGLDKNDYMRVYVDKVNKQLKWSQEDNLLKHKQHLVEQHQFNRIEGGTVRIEIIIDSSDALTYDDIKEYIQYEMVTDKSNDNNDTPCSEQFKGIVYKRLQELINNRMNGNNIDHTKITAILNDAYRNLDGFCKHIQSRNPGVTIGANTLDKYINEYIIKLYQDHGLKNGSFHNQMPNNHHAYRNNPNGLKTLHRVTTMIYIVIDKTFNNELPCSMEHVKSNLFLIILSNLDWTENYNSLSEDELERKIIAIVDNILATSVSKAYSSIHNHISNYHNNDMWGRNMLHNPYNGIPYGMQQHPWNNY